MNFKVGEIVYKIKGHGRHGGVSQLGRFRVTSVKDGVVTLSDRSRFRSGDGVSLKEKYDQVRGTDWAVQIEPASSDSTTIPPQQVHLHFLSGGHYRVSDKDAGFLAKSSGAPLPRIGYELKVELPARTFSPSSGLRDSRFMWLQRTPHHHGKDAPKRGWVWAVYGPGRT